MTTVPDWRLRDAAILDSRRARGRDDAKRLRTFDREFFEKKFASMFWPGMPEHERQNLARLGPSHFIHNGRKGKRRKGE